VDEVKDVITREQTSLKEKGPCKFPGANGPKFIEEMLLPMENGFKFSKEKWAYAPSRKCFPKQLGMLPPRNFGPYAKRSMYPWGT
jgi:hypothetical protein